jgi:hypothetical protein
MVVVRPVAVGRFAPDAACWSWRAVDSRALGSPPIGTVKTAAAPGRWSDAPIAVLVDS